MEQELREHVSGIWGLWGVQGCLEGTERETGADDCFDSDAAANHIDSRSGLRLCCEERSMAVPSTHAVRGSNDGRFPNKVMPSVRESFDGDEVSSRHETRRAP